MSALGSAADSLSARSYDCFRPKADMPPSISGLGGGQGGSPLSGAERTSGRVKLRVGS